MFQFGNAYFKNINFYSVNIDTEFVEVNWIGDILFDSIKKYPIRYLEEHVIYNPIELENFAVYFIDIFKKLNLF